MKILVTGGAGFIGSNIVDELISQGHDVAIIDNLTTGKKENINPKAKFFKRNLQDDLSDIFRKFRPDIIDHHAAQIDVRKSVEDPVFDATTNVIGFLNLMQNAVKYEVKKIINISSGGVVYGDPTKFPITEDFPKDPLSPYGITKNVCENYLKFYHIIHGIRFTTFRYSNVYGPRQDPKGEAGVIAIFSNLMLSGKQCTIFGDGKQIRDYVYVKDIVSANILAMTKGDNEAFNIATGVPTSVNQLFSTMKEVLGHEKEAIYAPARPGELMKNYLDCTKARKILGWTPKYDLKKGMQETTAWVKEQLSLS